MKGFTRRERRIIAAVYRDAARICGEREWEARHDRYWNLSPSNMAHDLKELMGGRSRQVLKHGCSLPMKKAGE